MPSPHLPTPAEELSAIRAEISRLRSREAELLAGGDPAPGHLFHPRPGWPIRRTAPATGQPA
ncbi:MAG: hypothetical protein IAE87_04290 [Rhodobacteraceae bacterium]|nr:hypothetical protein [Paracoccaceae bacterium]